MSESAQQAIALRRRYRDVVASNAIIVAGRWGQPCRAFNVHVEVSARAGGYLARVQDTLVGIEPNLLRCPLTSLHISVAWLLAVHVDYPDSKAAIWHRHGAKWVAELAAVAQVQDLTVSEELVFPSLVTSQRARLVLGQGQRRE